MRKSNLRFALVILAALAAISVFALLTAKRADRQMRGDLLLQAKLVSAAVDMEYVATLSGTEKDAAAPGFLQLRDRLVRARKVNPKCRYLYLLGQKRDGTVLFFLDTESEDSENYSPPGQAYPEATKVLRRAFASGCPVVEGPVSDRWGVWVSALVPLRREDKGRVAAVLGMDMDARFWGWQLARRCALPVGLATTQRAIDTGRVQPPHELELKHKSGKRVWVEVREGPVVEKGRTVAIVGALTDISERKSAEEVQAAALKEKGALLREFQHRVKNSLAIITGITEIEANHSADPAVRKALAALGGRIHTLSELYTLLYNSEQTSQVSLDRYFELISEFEMGAHLAGGGRIVLKRRLAPLVTDAKRASTLGLILNELLTNALKYAFPGGRSGIITVSLTDEGGDMVLEVEDDGVGLPTGFELLSSQGLGLQLVTMLASQLGGSVTFRSGKGTVFTVRAKNSQT